MQRVCSKLLKKLGLWKVDIGKTLGGRDKTIVFASSKGKKRRVALSLSRDDVHILAGKKIMTINLENGMVQRPRVNEKSRDKLMRMFAFDPGAKEVIFQIEKLLLKGTLVRCSYEGKMLYGMTTRERDEEGFCSVNLFRTTPIYFGGRDIGYGVYSHWVSESDADVVAENNAYIDGDFLMSNSIRAQPYVYVMMDGEGRFYKVMGNREAEIYRRFCFMIKTGVVPLPWVSEVSSLMSINNLTRVYHNPELRIVSSEIGAGGVESALDAFHDYCVTEIEWRIIETEPGVTMVEGRRR